MSDAARTYRLTENKRRYRARQKEYVADLEQRLADARAQGISATTQVQLAARKVVDENGRLRGLLRLAGFADEEIDVWADRERCGGSATKPDDGTDCERRREIEQKAKLCAVTFAASHKGRAVQREKTGLSRKNNRRIGVAAAGILPASTTTDLPSSTSASTEEPVIESGSSQSPESGTEMAACPADSETEPCAPPGREGQSRPCKLLSLLAENPTADITQVVTVGRSPNEHLRLKDTADREGDVECGKAYQMLMRYATSEEKMDYVAGALEAGCTPTRQGACAVKKKVIWEALDNMCG